MRMPNTLTLMGFPVHSPGTEVHAGGASDHVAVPVVQLMLVKMGLTIWMVPLNVTLGLRSTVHLESPYGKN